MLLEPLQLKSIITFLHIGYYTPANPIGSGFRLLKI